MYVCGCFPQFLLVLRLVGLFVVFLLSFLFFAGSLPLGLNGGDNWGPAWPRSSVIGSHLLLYMLLVLPGFFWVSRRCFVVWNWSPIECCLMYFFKFGVGIKRLFWGSKY